MALHYFDTSGLAKRYLPERGSQWVRALATAEPVVVSDLTMTEMASVFARRVRESSLTAVESRGLFATFLQDWDTFRTVPLDLGVVQAAADLLFAAPAAISLRTLDALHIVSARQAFAEAGSRGVVTGNFITADRNLLAAAAWAGLSILNPEDYP